MSKRIINIPPRDGANAEPGYAPDGVSLWSHTARKPRGGSGDISKDFQDRPNEYSRLDHQIMHEMSELARIERRVNSETDPERVAHFIRKRVETQKFLTRLRTEQKGLVS